MGCQCCKRLLVNVQCQWPAPTGRFEIARSRVFHTDMAP
jgi:hypothetical protein